MIYNNFYDLYKNVLDKYRKWLGKGIKWILPIDKENLHLVKIFLGSGTQIKHVKDMLWMNFAIGDKGLNATIEKMEGGKMIQSLLTSNEPMYLQHFKSIFEELWKKGIDAAERIREIEKRGGGQEGVFDSEGIKIIKNSTITQQLYLNILKSATKEIMLILPSINAFIRQGKIGAMQLLREAARDYNIKVRILMPTDGDMSVENEVLEQLKQYGPDNVDFRYIEPMSGNIKATFLVVDKKFSLVLEIIDDSKDSFIEAIGQSTYSNTKIGLLSYVAIFENLWTQTKLSQEIKQAYEQLKISDKIQKEFINVAAHELLDPIQPILGLTEVLRSLKESDSKLQQQDLFDAIIRNAKRLQHLTDDILDVTKIEGQSLQINKEHFELNDIITNVISDCKNQLNNDPSKEKNNVKIILFPPYENICVEADKNRPTQVICNLMSNALNFTEKGVISISVEIKKMMMTQIVTEISVKLWLVSRIPVEV